MKGGVGFYIVGAGLLLALAGCGRSFMSGERAAWRHQAEVECLKSGSVKIGIGVVQIEPIEGPGMCGADFPLRVTALGESAPGAEPGVTPSAAPLPNDIPDDAVLPPGRASNTYSPQRVYGAPYQLPQRDNGGPVYQSPQRASPPLGPTRGRQTVANITPATLTPPATLACPIVSALDHWVGEGVQPAAMRWFGTPVTEIKQISAYSCRSMVGAGGSGISEHAFGNAIDIAAFTFADGRRVTVQEGWHGTPEEQGFLRDVHLAACDNFTTVLAPGYNAAHYNHIHVDLMRRSSGERPCRPEAISGEVAAAKARAVYAGRQRGPAFTGAVQKNVQKSFSPAAVPGADGYLLDADDVLLGLKPAVQRHGAATDIELDGNDITGTVVPTASPRATSKKIKSTDDRLTAH